MSNNFSAIDIKQLQARGVSLPDADRQLEILRNPPQYRHLIEACVADKGVVILSAAEADSYAQIGINAAKQGRLSRFVPASGAASRMFKDLIELEDKTSLSRKDIQNSAVQEVMDRVMDFAFAADLKTSMARSGLDLEAAKDSPGLENIITHLLRQPGLDYAAKPKGLLKFHRYTDKSNTALEEHLKEGLLSVGDEKGQAKIHLTVTGSHRGMFEEVVAEFALGKVQVTYSEQKLSTDTLALDEEGQPFRDAAKQLLFRPGGHGALLENLNDLDADIVQIKNIDNIASDKMRDISVYWKHVLTGMLVQLQEKVHAYIQKLTLQPQDKETTADAGQFLKQAFHLPSVPDQAQELLRLLLRPIRVCGVVKNLGEPGGGPFWVKDAQGGISAQIVESAEVNTADKHQKEIMSKATHFNPVDIVVGLKDSAGQSFDLTLYRDDNAAFVAEKSFEGKRLKALERPGLWNGSMAGWMTLFVEVPQETFNPVKTVNDLLRPAHQP